MTSALSVREVDVEGGVCPGGGGEGEAWLGF